MTTMLKLSDGRGIDPADIDVGRDPDGVGANTGTTDAAGARLVALPGSFFGRTSVYEIAYSADTDRAKVEDAEGVSGITIDNDLDVALLMFPGAGGDTEADNALAETADANNVGTLVGKSRFRIPAGAQRTYAFDPVITRFDIKPSASATGTVGITTVSP